MAAMQQTLLASTAGGGVSANLLSWYEMEDNVATSVIVDVRGFKNLQARATTSTAQHQTGLIGSALRVNNNTVSKEAFGFATPSDTAFDFTGSVSWTAGGWFKSSASTNPDFAQRYFGRIAGTANYGGWGVTRSSGTTNLQAVTVSAGSIAGVTSTISITPTNWNFIVFRYASGTNTLKLTVNASSQSVNPSATFSAGTDDADFSIGRHIIRSSGVTDTAGTTADFDVDQFFVHSTSLADSTITFLYNGGAGVSYSAAALSGLL